MTESWIYWSTEGQILGVPYQTQHHQDIKMSDWIENTSNTSNYTWGDDTWGDDTCEESAANPFGKVFLPTLYILVFIVGFAGNSLVMWVLMKHRKQTNLTDIGLFNLALSDLLFVLMLPFQAHYSVSGEWTFGDFMCRFTTLSLRMGFFSGIFFMVFLTLDRYMVIMHSLTVARYRTMKAGVVVTVGVWMLSFSVSLPSFIFSKVSNESYGYGCYYSSDSDIWNRYHLFSMNVVGLILPLFIMIACYARIIPKLVNIKSTKRHRAIRVVISIVLVFFLFWAPFNIYLFLDYLNTEGYVDGETCQVEANLKVTATVTETFAYIHCCLNPIIYAFIGERFMRRVLNLLRTCCPPCFVLARDLPANLRRKSSIMSRSSEATSTFIT